MHIFVSRDRLILIFICEKITISLKEKLTFIQLFIHFGKFRFYNEKGEDVRPLSIFPYVPPPEEKMAQVSPHTNLPPSSYALPHHPD